LHKTQAAYLRQMGEQRNLKEEMGGIDAVVVEMIG
jgi:hypothetical protein